MGTPETVKEPFWKRPLVSFPGARWVGWALALAIILPMAWERYQERRPFNGFDLSNASVPQEEIASGGPGRDGIPALTDPRIVSADKADFLVDEDRILGLVVGDNPRAYPLQILNWHEIVNDRLGGEYVVVSYCPLCGTGIAYRGEHDGQRLRLGVSGLLYRDNLLMYDRATHSLWSQITGEALSGPLQGKHLENLPLEHMTWGQWRKRYPRTDVLSIRTGHRRDYDQDPYAAYAAQAFAPGEHRDDRLPPKAWVIGVELGGKTRAYPFATLMEMGPKGIVHDSLGGQPLEISYHGEDRSATVRDVDGNVLPMMLAYWFAWLGFHPETSLYQGAEGKVGKVGSE